MRQPTYTELRTAFQRGFDSIDDGDSFYTGFHARLKSLGYHHAPEVPCTCPDSGSHGHLPECRWVKE
jgi:hypothetical protein